MIMFVMFSVSIKTVIFQRRPLLFLVKTFSCPSRSKIVSMPPHTHPPSIHECDPSLFSALTALLYHACTCVKVLDSRPLRKLSKTPEKLHFGESPRSIGLIVRKQLQGLFQQLAHKKRYKNTAFLPFI